MSICAITNTGGERKGGAWEIPWVPSSTPSHWPLISPSGVKEHITVSFKRVLNLFLRRPCNVSIVGKSYI